MTAAKNMVTQEREAAELAAARRFVAMLRVFGAESPDKAMTDRLASMRTGIAERDIIDVADTVNRHYAEFKTVCVAGCGGRSGMGRYLTRDLAIIAAYADVLMSRTRATGTRAMYVRRAARQIEAESTVERGGQRRLFA